MTRMKVRHATGYRYESPVTRSYNEARLTPLTGLEQTTLESRVVTSPDCRQQRYWDYWGTQVTAFDVHVPHDALEVTATSVIETAAPAEPDTTPGWELLRSEPVRDRFIEMLTPTRRTTADDSLVAVGAELTADLAPYAAARTVGEAVREQVTYRPGTTGVATSAVEAWALGAGVCQDIAHVTLAVLRASGLPTRYVSGYLHPLEEAEIGQTVVGESHAWVEVWLGAWWGFDPTNGVPAGDRHVIVARGRDYGDVTPLKGVYSGGASQSLGVGVEITRLA